MAKTCPQCGNLNEDDTRVCTTCAHSFALPADQSKPPGIPRSGTGTPGVQPDPARPGRILAGAGIAVIVILIIFLVLANPDTAGIFPSSILAGTPRTIVTPVVTSYVVIETPLPEPTAVRPENLSPSMIPDTPRTSPAPTKAPVCPSDQRACGALCTDIMTDRTNCGACGVSCGSSMVCQGGHCSARCRTGETQCFDGCHNLSYDTQNCGTCGNACSVGLSCNKSVCAPAPPTAIPTYAG